MTLLNIFAPLFAVVMMLKVISRFRRHEKTLRELLVWFLIWGAFGYVGMYPETVEGLSGFLGIKSGLNVLIFFGFVMLFYIVFQLMVGVEQLEVKLTRVVRGIALKDSECPPSTKK